ncbi:hypothetical protein UA08_00598 [Talaromyces atroroseus]|uniref:C3H1-type domain-containing protein n=1 Tax=Talaromyces atroroseus TaxID=1441469 RepID=A0A225BDD9_TALAT|nr:hypothetical protein UA08_00598 [Talaromyces atroroseus]OKL64037.1 hypothetical protein UA08_00598 [Talaromyces atroroseus]
MSEIRPQFFLVRENNAITPLIALDELPNEISIHGVPRNMNVSDTRGMTSVGTVPTRGVYYIVDGHHCSVGITEAKNDSFALTTFYGKGKGRHYDKKHDGSTDKPAKVYCSYWIRTGECDFEQQGCRYKHIMPTDIETLETIGLQEIPAWYRDKHNIPSLRSRSRVGASYTQNNWRKRAAPMKAIEYGHGKEKSDVRSIKTISETKTITPETPSMAGETVTEAQVVDDPLDMVYRAGLNTTTTTTTTTKNNTTNGSSPVTPPSISRFIDFERIGNASFSYKYDAPQTPTGSGPVRSRRLFESQGPNHEYSMSPETIPSMTDTVNSFSPFSSLGGTPRSTTIQPPVTNNKTKRYSVAEEDINAADDTLDNLSNELAKFDNSEPKYRSISELLDSSIPEDRYGNLILF